MHLFVPYHWYRPAGGEGFADEVIQVARPPRTLGEVTAVKTMIADRNELEPQYVTLLGWTVMDEPT